MDFQYLCEELSALCWGGPCAGEAVGGAGVVQDLGQVGEHRLGEVLRGDPLGLLLGALGALGALGVAGVVRGDPVAVLGAGTSGSWIARGLVWAGVSAGVPVSAQIRATSASRPAVSMSS